MTVRLANLLHKLAQCQVADQKAGDDQLVFDSWRSPLKTRRPAAHMTNSLYGTDVVGIFRFYRAFAPAWLAQVAVVQSNEVKELSQRSF